MKSGAPCLAFFAAALWIAACGSGSAPDAGGDGASEDSGVDAWADADTDAGDAAGPDTKTDAGSDGQVDASPDGQSDASPDGHDGGGDEVLDGGFDGGFDAGPDGGLDAGPDGQDGGGDEFLDGGIDGGFDAGPDGGPDDGGDGAVTTPACQRVCSSPSDCAQGYAPWDADNYACPDGTCVYTGCRSDTECQSVPGMSGYLCRRLADWTIAQCVMACQTAVDCAQSYPPWDADNYACTEGACEYLGCLSDEECQAVPSMESYLCRSLYGSWPFCQPGCATAADCDLGSPAYDADNYACRDGLCVYLGCRSDAECRASITAYPTVCR
ncbi:MAG: hypothetical protein GYA21_12150 [Myxococcales bacterium]|nr:hypothetical protein [Myxococcales bacterium]